MIVFRILQQNLLDSDYRFCQANVNPVNMHFQMVFVRTHIKSGPYIFRNFGVFFPANFFSIANIFVENIHYPIEASNARFKKIL